MNWRRLLGLPEREPDTTDTNCQEIERAQEHADDLEERGGRVAESLTKRLRRNHWGETVAQIARREQR